MNETIWSSRGDVILMISLSVCLLFRLSQEDVFWNKCDFICLWLVDLNTSLKQNHAQVSQKYWVLHQTPLRSLPHKHFILSITRINKVRNYHCWVIGILNLFTPVELQSFVILFDSNGSLKIQWQKFLACAHLLTSFVLSSEASVFVYTVNKHRSNNAMTSYWKKSYLKLTYTKQLKNSKAFKSVPLLREDGSWCKSFTCPWT